MKAFVLFGHPAPDSFNRAIADQVASVLAEQGYQVDFHDLYQEAFDPVATAAELPRGAEVPEAIARHCRELSEADGIVIIHPNWWGQPPAILKGWIDRVIRPGVAYEFQPGDQGEGVPVGLLKARAALVFNTSNTTAEREEQVFGDPLELLWKNCIFNLCGIHRVERRMFRVMVTSGLEQRQGWLREVRQLVREYFPKEGVSDDSQV